MRLLLISLFSLVSATALAGDAPDTAARSAARTIVGNVVRLEGPGGVSRRGLPMCGVILGDRGVVVTIMRLGSTGSRMVLRLRGGRAVRAEVLVRDPVSGITALVMDEPVSGGLRVSGDNLSAGAPVQMAGYAFGVSRGFDTAAVGTGIVAQALPAKGDAAREHARYLLSTAVNPGDVGGALVDAEGRFAGVLLPGRDPLTGLSSAAPLSMLRKLFAANEMVREALTSAGDTSLSEWPVHDCLARVARQAWPAVISLTAEDHPIGSAFLFDGEGHAVTNRLGNARDLKAFLPDGREVAVKVLGEDERFDIAVIEVRGEKLPAPLPLSSKLPPVGTFVVALGNPNGPRGARGPLITTGLVGALNRKGNRFGALHTDAAVNRGNLGGPLLDLDGRVVGVLSSLAGESIRKVGVNSGVGYAIPIATILPRLEVLGRGESMTYRPGFLGITPDGVPIPGGGVRIAVVLRDHAAFRGGLLAGDVILKANGEETNDLDAAQRVFSALREGVEAVLVIRRGTETLTKKILPGRRPVNTSR